MVTFIITLIVIGLIAGFLARAIVPGRDAMGIGGTILLGIVGSFVGGFLADVLFNKNAADDAALHTVGIIGSTLGAILCLLVYRMATRRRLA
ncbi:MAG: GlsB/YeaQ/YmgE family stress response membrane protein [Acidimicrobiales bacterium]|nr:GlsB/YeaQ/YmgE family stress response membrane protein [Acidimicrobiales bacterium]